MVTLWCAGSERQVRRPPPVAGAPDRSRARVARKLRRFMQIALGDAGSFARVWLAVEQPIRFRIEHLDVANSR